MVHPKSKLPFLNTLAAILEWQVFVKKLFPFKTFYTRGEKHLGAAGIRPGPPA